MSYQTTLVRHNDQATSNWSGGTTTQIAIYPKDADYSKRNFVWRLSSANVESEESTFTALPGIWRLIMVLEGKMRLEHIGHHSISLKPFDQDSFSGDWATKSFGRVRDFNLMLAENCSGDLTAIEIKEKTSCQTYVQACSADNFSHTTLAFYCATGHLSITIEDTATYELEQKDLLLLDTSSHARLAITMANKSDSLTHVIRADIKY